MHDGVRPPLVADVTTQALGSTGVKVGNASSRRGYAGSTMKGDRVQRPGWTDFNRRDPGVALVELLGYLGEMLSYYQDRVAAVARLATRRRYVLALGAVSAMLVVCWRRRKGAGDD
jgi:hypothetical protein